MSMTDPLADMLTRIRNAQRAGKLHVTIPASKLKLAVAKVLESEGFVASISVEGEEPKKEIRLELKYFEHEPVIEHIERVSRPGLRRYAGARELPKVQGGLGVAIISTSQGVMSDRQARAEGRGGEVLCFVS